MNVYESDGTILIVVFVTLTATPFGGTVFTEILNRLPLSMQKLNFFIFESFFFICEVWFINQKTGIHIANSRVTHTYEVCVILFEMYDFRRIASFQRLVTVRRNWEAIIIEIINTTEQVTYKQ